MGEQATVPATERVKKGLANGDKSTGLTYGIFGLGAGGAANMLMNQYYQPWKVLSNGPKVALVAGMGLLGYLTGMDNTKK